MLLVQSVTVDVTDRVLETFIRIYVFLSTHGLCAQCVELHLNLVLNLLDLLLRLVFFQLFWLHFKIGYLTSRLTSFSVKVVNSLNEVSTRAFLKYLLLRRIHQTFEASMLRLQGRQLLNFLQIHLQVNVLSQFIMNFAVLVS